MFFILFFFSFVLIFFFLCFPYLKLRAPSSFSWASSDHLQALVHRPVVPNVLYVCRAGFPNDALGSVGKAARELEKVGCFKRLQKKYINNNNNKQKLENRKK